MRTAARCNPAGPLATAIRTRSLAAMLLGRLGKLRW
jgi:hypothetical protein